MNGLRAVAVALLCCLSMVAGVPVATDGVQASAATDHGGSVVSPGNTSEYLAISGAPDRTTTTDGQLDVAAAVGSETAAVRAESTEITLRSVMRGSDNETERREAVRRAAERVGTRIRRLEARERQAVDDYGSGNLTETQLLRAMAVIDAEARQLDGLVETLDRQNSRLDDPVLTRAELGEFRARLLPLYGPVRQRIGEIARTGAGQPIYVETADTDVVLSTVDDPELDDSQYVREAHIRDARGPSRPSSLSAEEVEQRFGELYPWTDENQEGGIQIGRYGGRPHVFPIAGVWPLDVGHAHAATTPGLVIFFDGSTGDVFREFQFNDPSVVPTTTVENETADGDLRVVVETTRAGGPLGVAVVDNGTDEHVDATVDVNGDPIGSTDGERLWTVGPHGDVTVNATHDGRTLTVETQLD
ncbi:DUF7096 domain-containing protein [Natronomonas amylolytica]|uniref:DUF7096 domain-containing protein n=1 Tax=Natronomonas amylolytica TaxID=3108498 RepID=UPI00300AD7B4